MTFQPLQPRLAFACAPHGAPRAARRPGPVRRDWATARLGNEPPLDTDAPTVSGGRHALSLRWLGASVLTGLAGALLLGAAIYVSSEGEVTFAELAEPAPASSPRSGEGGPAGLRKGDKLVRAETIASAKQSFRAPMTMKAGEREVIRLRSVTRLSTSLSLTSGLYATNIPAFNPLRFYAASDAERAAEPPPETADAEVSVVKTELSTLLLDTAGPALTDADAATQIQGEARALAEAGRQRELPLPSPAFLPRVLGAAGPDNGLFPRSVDTPFRSIEVRVVPENVTNLPKGPARAGDTAFEDRTVQVRRGDTLESVLKANGAGSADLRPIVTALGGRERAIEGLQLRLLVAPAPAPGQPRPLMRAILYGERGIEAIAAMTDAGAYVSVAPPPVEAAKPSGRTAEDEEEEQEGTGARLYESLYETLTKQELPRQTIEDLIRIFGYDVDFQRRVQPGDGLEIVYTTDEEGGQERLELLSATLTLGQDVRRVFRFQGDDGSVEYFDEQGRSLRKFLMRKPIVEARMTSGFGSRFHPILGYSKTHTGVDWANRVGTPILAAGNGTVVKVGWDSGYGRRIEIQHANGYVTTYNHQSAFARGIAPGVRVRQGQVIGFVGSTGLSTGPHLHYEVLVNGRFVDPMKIRVPRGRELDGRALADFGRQRDQAEALAKRAGASNQLAASEPR